MGKITSYKIGDNFYLNEQTVDMPLVTAEAKVEIKHQYIIIDRSGSMWSQLDSVVETIKDYVMSLPNGSTVSVGYFSSPGCYELSVPYVLKKEQEAVINTVDRYKSALGCTDFIEVLRKIKETSGSEKGSLFFFTDGCHNSGGPFSDVISTLKDLKEQLDVAVFVGCGWIDRDNMNEMAEVSDGAFIHLDNFSDFKQALLDFGEAVKDSAPSIVVEVPEGVENVCSLISRNTVINYVVPEDRNISYKASTSRSKQCIYYISKEPKGVEKEIGSKDEILVRTIACSAFRQNQPTKAIKILNSIGDKYFMRKMENAFTADECASAENELAKSIQDTKKRYKEGVVTNYLPDPDAFCVLDALSILSKDESAKLHLNDPEFEYSAISRKTEQVDGSKLIYPEDISASATDIKFHESRLNASLSVNYTASVPLNSGEFNSTNAKNEDLTKYGLAEGCLYPVACFRTYNIILDGKLNTKKLILSDLEKSSIKDLGAYITLRDDKKYVLDLTQLPLINAGYLKTASALELGKSCWKAFILSTEASVIKYLQKRLNAESSSEDQEDSALKFLAENYFIKNGAYQPPKVQAPVTDKYSAYEFKVSFKGWSKASASSVIKKIDAGKAPTQRESIVEYFYDRFKDSDAETLSKTLKDVNKESRELASKIQSAKMAIVLVNHGSMEEFSDRSNQVLDIPMTDYITLPDWDAVPATFEITQTEVEI